MNNLFYLSIFIYALGLIAAVLAVAYSSWLLIGVMTSCYIIALFVAIKVYDKP